MKIYFGQLYIQAGISFPFSSSFQRFLSEEVSKLVEMNPKFEQSYGTEYELKKVYGALEVAKRALKKGIEAHPLGALHDVKKGTLYTCSSCGTRLGWGPNAARLANYCHGCGQKIDWRGTPRE